MEQKITELLCTVCKQIIGIDGTVRGYKTANGNNIVYLCGKHRNKQISQFEGEYELQQ